MSLTIFDLSGKVAVVSGGGDGLGRAMSIGLAEAGANVVVCSRKAEKCEQTAQELNKLGVRALGLKCDLTKEPDVEAVVDETVKRFGKVDILLNNAGRTWGAAPEDLKFEDWKKVIDVNLNGTFLFCQHAGRKMIGQGGGKIINISSYAGIAGTDPEHLNAIAYNASKGALVTFTKDLATKWAAHHINVNCIAPGWFPTKMTKWTLDNKGADILKRVPLSRFGEAEDLKGVAVFLASKAADYVTGQIISVDGGLTIYH